MAKIRDESNSVKSKAVAAVRDARSLGYEDFRLPADGRKWVSVSKQRRALYMELCTYADADGTNACPSIGSLQRCAGPERTTFRRMQELKQLGFVVDKGKSRFQGTTYREIRLPREDGETEMTLVQLRRLRDRRQQQNRDGKLRPPRGADPGGYVEWETLSRSEFPKLWEQLDQETTSILPDSQDSPTLPDSLTKLADFPSNQEVAPILPDSYLQSSILPDRCTTLPDRAPILPRSGTRPSNQTDQSDRPNINAISPKVTNEEFIQEQNLKAQRSENQKAPTLQEQTIPLWKLSEDGHAVACPYCHSEVNNSRAAARRHIESCALNPKRLQSRIADLRRISWENEKCGRGDVENPKVHAEIAELEAKLASSSAGGVSDASRSTTRRV